MRQAVADTFVSLVDSWELGKKFQVRTRRTRNPSPATERGHALEPCHALVRVFCLSGMLSMEEKEHGETGHVCAVHC